MLCGSAQTLSILGSTSSSDRSGGCPCASVFPQRTGAQAKKSAQQELRTFRQLPLSGLVILSSHRTDDAPARGELPAGGLTGSEAAVLCLRGGLGFVFMLLRPSARNRIIGPGAQINENILKIAHHVSVHTERRHHGPLRRVDILAPVHDHS